jgi:hypothetical protein
MLPAIRRHACIAFRHLRAEAREEVTQNVVASALSAFVRLVELGKADIAYAMPLARYAVRQYHDGRRMGNRMNIHDISSEYCQHKKNVVVDRLDKYDANEEEWQELVVEDKHAGPAEVAATRMDFSAWLSVLPRRLRKIATFLALGETTTAAAKRFHVSQGRISQVRKELLEAWRRFQGEEPALALA